MLCGERVCSWDSHSVNLLSYGIPGVIHWSSSTIGMPLFGKKKRVMCIECANSFHDGFPATTKLLKCGHRFCSVCIRDKKMNSDMACFRCNPDGEGSYMKSLMKLNEQRRSLASALRGSSEMLDKPAVSSSSTEASRQPSRMSGDSAVLDRTKKANVAGKRRPAPPVPVAVPKTTPAYASCSGTGAVGISRVRSVRFELPRVSSREAASSSDRKTEASTDGKVEVAVARKTVTSVPAVGKSVASVPAVGKSVASVPAVGKPVASVPAVGKSVASVPAVGKPVASVPAVGKSVASVPADIKKTAAPAPADIKKTAAPAPADIKKTVAPTDRKDMLNGGKAEAQCRSKPQDLVSSYTASLKKWSAVCSRSDVTAKPERKTEASSTFAPVAPEVDNAWSRGKVSDHAYNIAASLAQLHADRTKSDAGGISKNKKSNSSESYVDWLAAVEPGLRKQSEKVGFSETFNEAERKKACEEYINHRSVDGVRLRGASGAVSSPA